MLGWFTATKVPFSVEPVQQMHPASRPPYFSTPGAPQSVAEAAGMSRVGGAAYPQPAISQPYPLPTRHHPQQAAPLPNPHPHPHPHSHPHPAILHSPQQRLGAGASSHSSQALRHFAQQHHVGQHPQQQQQKQQSPQQQQQQQQQQERVRKPEGVCELCGISAMFLCSTCRTVWYCSQRCQVTALSSPTLCRAQSHSHWLTD